jgi:aspartate kinase
MKIKVYKCGGSFFIPKIIKNFKKVLIKNTHTGHTLFVVSAVKEVTRFLNLIFIIKTQKKVNQEFKDLTILLILNEFHKIHTNLISELFIGKDKSFAIKKFESTFLELKKTISFDKKGDSEDKLYASILKFGELASSEILSEYLNSLGVKNKWFDARRYVVTSTSNREAKILKINLGFKKLFSKSKILVTQGFIGKNKEGEDTVLGFDGSDYSASQFANVLAKDKNEMILTFWKDVKGVYTENPSCNPRAHLIHKMSRTEYAHNVEKNKSFVVRPDSISSLDKNVKVHIRSFIDMSEIGTKIYGE